MSRFAEAGENATALASFWRDFVRRPSTSRTPGRQFIEGPLDAHPVWMTRDDDAERALTFTPNVFLGGLEDDNVVEVPCLHVAIRDGEAELALERVEALGLPLPHYLLRGRQTLHVLWRIEPLRRPPKKAPEAHHHAWRQCLLAWRMAQVKLALAFAADEGTSNDVRDRTRGVPGPATVGDAYTARLPLPHPPTPSRYLGSDAELIAAHPERPTLRIREVSAPLNLAFDAPAWSRVRPHTGRGPIFSMGSDAWTSSPRFLEAMGQKREGERHPAALTIACILRWAGRDRETVLDTLRGWHAQNLDQRHFPDERSQSDELEDLVEWAFRKLVPGGPTRPEPEIRGRYTARERAMEAVWRFLESQEAAALGWVGTQEDLARGATLWAAEAESGAVVTRDSLQKLLPALKSRGLVAAVERVGRTWTTTWHLPRDAGAGPTGGQAPGGGGQGAEAVSVAAKKSENSNAGQPFDSQRQLRMSIGRPRLLPLALDLASVSSWSLAALVSSGHSSSGPPVGMVEARLVEQLRSAEGLRGSMILGSGIQGSGLAPAAAEAPSAPPGSEHPAGSPVEMPGGETERVAQARVLCALGFSVILLKPQTKEPVANRWMPAQVRAAPADELERALARQPEANLAIVCGTVSGVVAIDLDSEAALAWARRHLPPTPLRSRTARGEHWFYRHPGGGPVRNRARLRGFAVDVKGDGGYVVAPGSLHPSGIRYEALGTWDEASRAALPLFDPTWLLSDEEALEPGLLPGEDEAAQALRWLRNLREAARTGNWRALRRDRDGRLSGPGGGRATPGDDDS